MPDADVQLVVEEQVTQLGVNAGGAAPSGTPMSSFGTLSALSGAAFYSEKAGAPFSAPAALFTAYADSAAAAAANAAVDDLSGITNVPAARSKLGTGYMYANKPAFTLVGNTSKQSMFGTAITVALADIEIPSVWRVTASGTLVNNTGTSTYTQAVEFEIKQGSDISASFGAQAVVLATGQSRSWFMYGEIVIPATNIVIPRICFDMSTGAGSTIFSPVEVIGAQYRSNSTPVTTIETNAAFTVNMYSTFSNAGLLGNMGSFEMLKMGKGT